MDTKTAPPAASPSAPPAMPAPSIVSNIPVHTQAAAPAQPANDSELDKLMQDVGNILKKEGQKPEKKGFGLFGHYHKGHSQPQQANAVPAQAAPGPMQMNLHPQPQAPLPTPFAPPATAAKPVPAPAPTKPKSAAQKPVMAILLAIIVTGSLAALAVLTYKNG